MAYRYRGKSRTGWPCRRGQIERGRGGGGGGTDPGRCCRWQNGLTIVATASLRDFSLPVVLFRSCTILVPTTERVSMEGNVIMCDLLSPVSQKIQQQFLNRPANAGFDYERDGERGRGEEDDRERRKRPQRRRRSKPAGPDLGAVLSRGANPANWGTPVEGLEAKAAR